MTEFHKGFQDVDASGDSAGLVNLMNRANTFEEILRYRELMIELCPVNSGDHILDAGCGLGQEVQRLANLVGPLGRAVGIDKSETMVAEATKKIEATNSPIEFRVADVHRLPFENDIFDLVRAERALMYVDDPEKAIAEMARVLKPGGHVAVFEVDFKGLFIDSDFGDLARTIEDVCRSAPPNPLIGRELPHLYRLAGLHIERIHPITVKMPMIQAQSAYSAPLNIAVEEGKISKQELKSWWEEQENLDEEGQSCFFHPGYIVVGRSP